MSSQLRFAVENRKRHLIDELIEQVCLKFAIDNYTSCL